jgi:hypothetical protein
MAADSPRSPWLNLKSAGLYLDRSPRFLARAVKRGELRAARIGGRAELFFLASWLDDFMLRNSTPAEVVRRRA